MNYVIYLLKCGKCRYVGSSNNFNRRHKQHLKDLKLNRHVNDFLQLEYNKGYKVEHKILKKGFTLFKRQILLDEQRMIVKHSNSNEVNASAYTNYSKKEFLMDFTDFIVKNWKLISCLIFIILIVGFTMTPEQAMYYIDLLVKVWSSQ